MSSLTNNFNELLNRIGHGREFSQASFEPVYYLVFKPSEILEVKRLTPSWTAKLSDAGYEVTRFSIAAEIADILGSAKMRKIWLAADKKAPLDWDKTNASLTNALVKGDGGPLQDRLESVLETISKKENALLLVTDLEALHPYLRIGSLEGRLYGKFNIPTVFLYPGERTGKTRLKFLGFYPDDGNYRSVHVGG
jgi:hypothetical protein